MTRLASKKFILFLLLTAGLPLRVFAEDNLLPNEDLLVPDLFQIESFEWQQLEIPGADVGHETTMKYNRELLRGAVVDYLESKLVSLGIPQPAMTLTGAAVIFAVGQDAKLNLNKSKTMELQFKDMREEDRAILYRLKYSW